MRLFLSMIAWGVTWLLINNCILIKIKACTNTVAAAGYSGITYLYYIFETMCRLTIVVKTI